MKLLKTKIILLVLFVFSVVLFINKDNIKIMIINSQQVENETSHLEEYVQIFQDDAAKEELALLYYLNSDYDKSSNIYEELLLSNPNDVSILHKSALAYEMQLSIEKAIKLRETIVTLDSQHSVNYDMLILDFLLTDPKKALNYSNRVINVIKDVAHMSDLKEFYIDRHKILKQYVKLYFDYSKNQGYLYLLKNMIYLTEDEERILTSLLYQKVKENKIFDEEYYEIINLIENLGISLL